MIKDEFQKLNNQYKLLLAQNKEQLINALVIYYGEEYRPKITKIIDEVVIFWFIPPDFFTLYQTVVNRMVERRVMATSLILQELDFSLAPLEIQGHFLSFAQDKSNIVVEGHIVKAFSPKNKQDYQKILKTLFGPKGMFDLDFKKNCPLANFAFLDKYHQQEILKLLFHTDILSLDIKEKITKSQNLMAKFGKTFAWESQFLILNNISEYIKQNSTVKNNFWTNLNHRFPWQIIGTNDPRIYDKNSYKYIYDTMREQIQNAYAFHQLISNNSHLIGFPLFIVQDQEFIHELNHALKSEILSFKDGAPVTKSGLVTAQDDIFFEEIFNDLEAREITDIFHDLNGPIFKNQQDYGIEGIGGYYPFFPLGEDFYQYFKEDIKKASITEDLNVLIQKVGKKAYLEYKNYILNIRKNLNLDQRIVYLRKISKEQIAACKMMTNQMVNNAQENGLANLDHNLTDYEIVGRTKSGILKVRKLEKTS